MRKIILTMLFFIFFTTSSYCNEILNKHLVCSIPREIFMKEKESISSCNLESKEFYFIKFFKKIGKPILLNMNLKSEDIIQLDDNNLAIVLNLKFKNDKIETNFNEENKKIISNVKKIKEEFTDILIDEISELDVFPYKPYIDSIAVEKKRSSIYLIYSNAGKMQYLNWNLIFSTDPLVRKRLKLEQGEKEFSTTEKIKKSAIFDWS